MTFISYARVCDIATEKHHLALKKGDEVQLLDMSDDEWLKGRCGGKEGLFPKACVRVLREEVRNVIALQNFTAKSE